MTTYDAPTTLNPLHIRRMLGRGVWSTPFRFGPDGWRFDNLNGSSRIIVTVAPEADADWIHASVSRTDETPSYADLKHLHAAVFGDRWAYQIFAPPSDHINIHPHALHLWGRVDGKPALPDFTHGTRSI